MKEKLWKILCVYALLLILIGCGNQQDIQQNGYEQQGSTRNDPALSNPSLQAPGDPDYLRHGSGKITERRQGYETQYKGD